MKTTFLLAVLAMAAMTFRASSQNVIVTGGGAPVNQTIVIQRPVIVQAPVTCAAPAIYAAPVMPYCSSSSKVIYFGGPEARWRSGYYGCGYGYTPNVIYFGRGQSFYQGYRFQHCR